MDLPNSGNKIHTTLQDSEYRLKNWKEYYLMRNSDRLLKKRSKSLAENKFISHRALQKQNYQRKLYSIKTNINEIKNKKTSWAYKTAGSFQKHK